MFRVALLQTRKQILGRDTTKGIIHNVKKLNPCFDYIGKRRSLHQKGSDFSLEDLKLQEIIKSANVGKGKDQQNENDTITKESTMNLGESARSDLRSSPSEQGTKHTIANARLENDGNKTNESSSKKLPELTILTAESIHREIQNLPSQIERKRSEISVKAASFFESLQGTIFKATRALNDVTGYSSIERLRDSIQKLETQLKEAKDDVKSNKMLYNEAIEKRSTSQKEINELLTRKHNWTSQDVERFTELYRNDHLNEQNEHTTKTNLEQAETEVDAIQVKLTQSILTRYHEEQIWSDKIRRASTWGTWILTGINIFIFIIATLVVEPWKRSRLVDSFEQKVQIALTEFATENGLNVKHSGADLQSNSISLNTSDRILAAPASSNDNLHPASIKASSNSTSVAQGSWWAQTKIKIIQIYSVLFSRDVSNIDLRKQDLAFVISTTCLLSTGLTSLALLYYS